MLLNVQANARIIVLAFINDLFWPKLLFALLYASKYDSHCSKIFRDPDSHIIQLSMHIVLQFFTFMVGTVGASQLHLNCPVCVGGVPED